MHADIAAAVAAVITKEPAEAPDRVLERRYVELFQGFAALYPALKRPGVW